jgi:hypothetical protein
VTAEYIDDVVYVRGYYPELAPALLSWVAARAGYEPPRADKPFVLVEFGCGHGVSLAVHAAAYPHGRFVGIDVLPEHVASARRACEGLPNVEVHETSFAAASDLAVGDVDYVVAHGVWSWVPEAARSDALRFVEAKLRRGGVFYISYNAFPGQAVLAGAHRLFAEAARGGTGDSAARAAHARDVLLRLRDAKPRSFRHGERVDRHVEGWRKEDPAYLAYEFLIPVRTSFWFADVARDFASRGFAWAGQALLSKDVWDVQLTDAQIRAAAAFDDPLARETWKDACVDEMFRRDVFVRSAPRARPVDVPLGLLPLRVGMTRDPAKIDRNPKVGIGTVRFGHAFDERLIARLADAPSVADLAVDPELGKDPRRLTKVIDLLLATKQAVPFVRAPVARRAGGPWTVSAFDRAALRQRIAGDTGGICASPIAGKGIRPTVREALVLGAVVDGGIDGAVARARATLAEQRRVLVTDGRRMSAEDAGPVLEAELAALLGGGIDRYVRLGIVREA